MKFEFLISLENILYYDFRTTTFRDKNDRWISSCILLVDILPEKKDLQSISNIF